MLVSNENEKGCKRRITAKMLLCKTTTERRGRTKKALSQSCLVRRRISNRRSCRITLHRAGPPDPICSLPIQSGRVGIRTRVTALAYARQCNSTPFARRELIPALQTKSVRLTLSNPKNQRLELASGRTPDSVFSVICLDACAPVTPASRTLASSLRQDLRISAQAHLPCSRLDIHPAAAVSGDAGGPLPHRFAPAPFAWEGFFSVAVVVRPARVPPERGSGRGLP